MGQVNPNGTYNGRVYDSGESHEASLTITASDPQTGNISQASMQYYGLSFKVDGTFAYQSLTGESAVTFNLRAEASSAEHNVLIISLRSPDSNYFGLNGTVRVDRGGPNVGKTYNIEFRKN
ncbi:hypothetical protein PS718_01001 [Pseudomonas fluorescens]|uniref:Uncharacterized protein n=1 Tax=Pseudomonas fluorescens TaxID=294 RepID=A0A5E7AZW3_PSEFL|nr:hypothetical protein [Pseudomonas fluorescens]VVN79643.1 hypothetical protein PS718_01001 [Pseudomonas fluorescens]